MSERKQDAVQEVFKSISRIEKGVNKLKRNEYHLRRKTKRYRKHIKAMERGIKWRNEVIAELATQLGYAEGGTVTFSAEDFSLFKELTETVPMPNKKLEKLFDQTREVEERR